MRNLLEFLIKYGSAFIFTILFVTSVALLVTNGAYHSSIWFTSANAVSSKVYGMSNGVTDYFNLKSINEDLVRSNAELESQVLNLKETVAKYQSIIDDTLDYSQTRRYDYILASVLNNSTIHPRNYLTIDKGSLDGVKEGMGVVDHNGLIGIVNVTGPNSARVISLLNNTQHISVRLKGTSTVGSLTWKTNDPQYAYMEEVPRHSVFKKGDRVVTSGFSATFPADLNVGTVEGRVNANDDNFYVLKVKLSSDFGKLKAVRVLRDSYSEEIDSLTNFDI